MGLAGAQDDSLDIKAVSGIDQEEAAVDEVGSATLHGKQGEGLFRLDVLGTHLHLPQIPTCVSGCHSNAVGRVSSDALVGIPAAEDSTVEVPDATVVVVAASG